MIRLPQIFLPQEYIVMLKANLHASSESYSKIYTHIVESPSLHRLIEAKFSLELGDVGIQSFLQSLGWKGMRDRIAALYISHASYTQFPISPSLYLVEDIVDLENDLSPYSLGGYSRAYLLGFYLKMVQIEYFKKNPDEGQEVIRIDGDVLDLLKYQKAKHVKIDWLIIMLQKFVDFIGIDEVETFLRSGDSNYEDLYEMLEDKQKSDLLEDLLSYGLAIHEPEMYMANQEA